VAEQLQHARAEPRARVVGWHRLPGPAEEAIAAEERRVPVLVGEARGALDPWMRGPHQALLLFHQAQYIGRAAHVIDGAVALRLLAEGLSLLATQRPVDRPREEADPVPTQVDIGLLAGQEEDLVVGEP